MKKKLMNIFVVILVLGGVALLAYPYANFLISQQRQSYVTQDYNDSLAKLTAEQLASEWERVQAYNDALSTNVLYDPFASGEREMDLDYLSLLNIEENGVMSRVKIPRISVDLPIYHGTSTKTLEKGIGHLEGSALPVGGEGTHAVLTGHTGLNTAKLFSDLTELELGDEFYIYTLGQILAYRIDSIIVAKPTDVDTLFAVKGKDYVTLVTCTPYGINSHRLLVRGERVDYTPDEIEGLINSTKAIISKETYMLYAGIALLTALIVIAYVVIRRRKYKTRK